MLVQNGNNVAEFIVPSGSGYEWSRIFCRVTLNGISSDNFGLHWVEIT